MSKLFFQAKDFFRSLSIISISLISIFAISCNQPNGVILPEANSKKFHETQEQLRTLLEQEDVSTETRFAIMKNIAGNLQAVHDYPALILFLTEWVENHPEDGYNSYWLLQTGYAYLKCESKPMAQYYFEKILRNYNDLMIQGQSVHELCLRQLLQISTVPANRIAYYNQLITRFPNNVNITELYVRMAQEYEQEGEWNQVLRCYQLFLDQEDATTIQIAGLPNAYQTAKQLIDFNNSSKDWTFETLDGLVKAIKSALYSGDAYWLDNLKSKVNFFAMSWRQDENSENAQSEVSMQSYMYEKSIHYSPTLDDSSNPSEAYLKTWGWTSYMNVWYFYFRKVNFPADPDIHGRWEWAGIYYGDKM